MLEDNGEEVDKQVKDMFREKTPQELCKQYSENQGAVTMINADSNGAIMSVMQCLMEAGDMAKHMLLRSFKGEEGSYPLSEMMRKLYSDVFQKPLSQVKKPKLDMGFVTEALSSIFDKDTSNDSSQVLLLLCGSLSQEFDKGQKEGSKEESIVQQVFKFEIEEQFECEDEHIKIDLRHEFLLEVDRAKPV